MPRILTSRPSVVTHWRLLVCLLGAVNLAAAPASAAPPNPVLTNVFPAGGQAGSTLVVTVAGSALNGATSLRTGIPRCSVEPAGPNQFRLTIPQDTPLGQYDLQVVTPNGLSSLRTFTVGRYAEILETEPNNLATAPQSVPLDVVINGRIDPGDLDQYSFVAPQGQRIIVECHAEQIDSKLRGILEVYDPAGRRLAVNRGWAGTDPLIAFTTPTAGAYVVKLSDLAFTGSADHLYRLTIHTGPRVAFAIPAVVQRGKSTRVTFYGWNLGQPEREVAGAAEATGLSGGAAPNSITAAETGNASSADAPATSNNPPPPFTLDGFALESVTLDITPPPNPRAERVRRRSTQATLDSFTVDSALLGEPVRVSVTDIPVVADTADNHNPTAPQTIPLPAEVSGQLIAGDEQDWFAVYLRRGEVLWLEAWGERIGSPVDLDLTILDAAGQVELARFRDNLDQPGDKRFPAGPLDPAGRWVAPADGRFLILVRNLTGSLADDPRRLYRLSVRREEPDFHVVARPRTPGPSGWNIPRGGSLVVDLLAFRQRGLNESIRISAQNLPVGLHCPDVWIGPGVQSAPLVITASRTIDPMIGVLHLEGHAASVGSRPVHAGTVVQTNTPLGNSRLIDELAFAVTAGDAPLRLTARAHEPQPDVLFGELQPYHAPGSMVDVFVEVDRRDDSHQAPIHLLGTGLPDLISPQTAIIPAGTRRGVISFYLPSTLPPGKYSFAVEGETTVPTGAKNAQGVPVTEKVTVTTNTVTIDVEPAAFLVAVDPTAPRRIRRGETLRVAYSARRTNGFIGKIHTELFAPLGVDGLRGRGVTFVGQSETGEIQIIANPDAPLGQIPFLRLSAIGVVEDKPTYHGSCLLNLEIVE